MVDGRHIFSSLTKSVGVYIPINKDSYLRWDKFIPNIYINIYIYIISLCSLAAGGWVVGYTQGACRLVGGVTLETQAHLRKLIWKLENGTLEEEIPVGTHLFQVP